MEGYRTFNDCGRGLLAFPIAESFAIAFAESFAFTKPVALPITESVTFALAEPVTVLVTFTSWDVFRWTVRAVRGFSDPKWGH